MCSTYDEDRIAGASIVVVATEQTNRSSRECENENRDGYLGNLKDKIELWHLNNVWVRGIKTRLWTDAIHFSFLIIETGSEKKYEM